VGVGTWVFDGVGLLKTDESGWGHGRARVRGGEESRVLLVRG